MRGKFLAEFELVFKYTFKGYFRPIADFYYSFIYEGYGEKSDNSEVDLKKVLISLNDISARLMNIERLLEVFKDEKSKSDKNDISSILKKSKKTKDSEYLNSLFGLNVNCLIAERSVGFSLRKFPYDRGAPLVSLLDMSSEGEINLIKNLYKLMISDNCPSHIKMLLMNFFVLYGKGERGAAMEILKWASEQFDFLEKEILASHHGGS